MKLTTGERLKDLRVERKLTLEQLADEVGISKSALGKYELDSGKGKRKKLNHFFSWPQATKMDGSTSWLIDFMKCAEYNKERG